MDRSKLYFWYVALIHITAGVERTTRDRMYLREAEQDQRRNSELKHPAYPQLQQMKNTELKEKGESAVFP